MRADPDGAVEIGQAIGREADVERLWAALVDRHVLLTARLGVGKTTLARLALGHPPSGWIGQHVALADHATAEDTCTAVAEALTVDRDDAPVGKLVVLDDLDRWVRTVGRADPDAVTRLTRLVTDAIEQHPNLRLLWISSVRVELLGAPGTGPLAELIAGCARISLDTLSPESGARLVMSLLLGESITARDRAAFGRVLADRCDHTPRWIHCAIAYFVARRRPIADGDLDRCLVEVAAQPNAAPWNLAQELTPLDEYPQPQRGLALSILDRIAVAEDRALSFAHLREQFAMEATIDDDAIRRVLAALGEDQLVRESGGRTRFAGELLRVAWVHQRGL